MIPQLLGKQARYYYGARMPTTYSLPAPIGGLNTRDAYSAMPETDAIQMDNWFPNTDGVESRKGYESHGTSASALVETLAALNAGTTSKLVAASGGNLYTVPDAGGSLVSIGSGYSNARWNTEHYNNRLVFCNGADTPIEYDGTTVANIAITGSGLTSSDLILPFSFKGSIFYIEKDTLSFWYPDTIGGYSGAYSEFPLDTIARKGGTIVTAASWTRDAGDGVDDYAAFFTSNGEVIVYSGIDPGDASSWVLVGVYPIGAALSPRSITRFGGDVYVITKSDAVPLSSLIAGGNLASSLSKLSGGISSAAQSYGGNYGWQAILYPKGNRILFNVPVAEGSTYWQYGINTITGAAFRFTGMNGACWCVYNDNLYFGGYQTVYKADTGLKDDGGYVNVTLRSAFSLLQNPQRKKFNIGSPNFYTDGNVTLNLGTSYDYSDTIINQTVSSESSGTPWGSPWGSPWSPEDRSRNPKYGLSGQGRAVSYKIGASLKGQDVKLYRMDYSYTPMARF